MQQRLTRSRSERVIWGVCGGLGSYFGVDPVIVRLIFIVLAVTTGIGLLAYPLLALAMPADRTNGPTAATGFPAPPVTMNPPTTQPNTGQTINLRVDEPPATQFVPPQPDVPPPATAPRQPRDRWRNLGVLLLGLGVFLLAQQLGFAVDLVWPAIIIGLGFWLLRRRH